MGGGRVGTGTGDAGRTGALGNQIKDMETRVAVQEKIEQELEGLESRLMNLQMLKDCSGE